MILQEEQYVISWLSQYEALTKTQLIRMLRKTDSISKRILQGLKKRFMIYPINGGFYYGVDPACTPDQRTIQAMWVLLHYIDKIDPLAHYRASYPSQIFFLKEDVGYEIVVLNEGEEKLTRLLQPEENLKYIIVVPDISMVKKVTLPKAPCIFATVDFQGEDDPKITFYSEETSVE